MWMFSGTIAAMVALSRYGLAVGSSLALAGLSLACEGRSLPPPEPNACQQLSELRKACELDEQACVTEQDECQASCYVGWGCEELVSPWADPGVLACLWNCSPRFSCADGSEIYATFRCDGEADCADAEDEADCPSSDAGGSSPSAPDARISERSDAGGATGGASATRASDGGPTTGVGLDASLSEPLGDELDGGKP